MNEELEVAKVELKNANDFVDIKSNPVVDNVLMPVVKAIPVVGDMIDSTMNKVLEEFQKKKEEQFIEVVLKDQHSITSDMVNDVEFIVNYARTLEAVKRLATNDKVKYFGNLIRKGYLSGGHIENSEFEEYLEILNTMSFREIQYLIDFKRYCEEKKKAETRYYRNHWTGYMFEYSKVYKISGSELCSIFMRIKRTGFVEEIYETESGDVDEDDNSFNSLTVESNGFFVDESFDRFYDMVLKIEV